MMGRTIQAEPTRKRTKTKPTGELHTDFLSKYEEEQMRTGLQGEGGFVSIPIG